MKALWQYETFQVSLFLLTGGIEIVNAKDYDKGCYRYLTSCAI